MSTDKTLEIVNVLTDLIFLTILLIQQISQKSDEEVIEAIHKQRERTNALLKELR